MKSETAARAGDVPKHREAQVVEERREEASKK